MERKGGVKGKKIRRVGPIPVGLTDTATCQGVHPDFCETQGPESAVLGELVNADGDVFFLLPAAAFYSPGPR